MGKGKGKSGDAAAKGRGVSSDADEGEGDADGDEDGDGDEDEDEEVKGGDGLSTDEEGSRGAGDDGTGSEDEHGTLAPDEVRAMLLRRAKRKNKGASGGRALGKAKPARGDAPARSGSKKVMRKWEDSKLSKKEVEALDYSRKLGGASAEESAAAMRGTAFAQGDSLVDRSDEVWEETEEAEHKGDGEEESKGGEGSASAKKGWGLSSKLSGWLGQLSGNKVLTREDVDPVMAVLRDRLIGKNVAKEVADSLCESVAQHLVGQKLGSFTRVATVVEEALSEALERILTPKKSTDILRAVMAAQEQKRPYTVVFCGVNGVGKSTSLSKICYYLRQKSLSVLIAACDTFRSGAVEQLQTHAVRLGVQVFDQGYAKDPSAVARAAIAKATAEHIDVVLVDTAGRMQNNTSLMKALAKLVFDNRPDLVLFVGEALVGNDGVDQLMEFNGALLRESESLSAPRAIDGIVLTKFDTVDDKVGAAISMAYKTSQPVMFVGTGQKYTHLRRLNVRTVVTALLK